MKACSGLLLSQGRLLLPPLASLAHAQRAGFGALTPPTYHATHQQHGAHRSARSTVQATSATRSLAAEPTHMGHNTQVEQSEATGVVRVTLTVTAKDIAAARNAGGGSRALRLDAFLATALASGKAGSRSKAQSAIRSGTVTVNGRVASKASATLSAGDVVLAEIEPPPLLQALPEPIPLDVLYEDEHLMVINKPAGMAVHVSPGHHTGTLVNALLHHCGLPGLGQGIEHHQEGVSNEPHNHHHNHQHQQQQQGQQQHAKDTVQQGAREVGSYSLDGLRGLVGGAPAPAGWAVSDGSEYSSDHSSESERGSGDRRGTGRGAAVSAGVVSGEGLVGLEEGVGEDELDEVVEDFGGGEGGHSGVVSTGGVLAVGEVATAGGEKNGLGYGVGMPESSSSTPGILRPGIVHRLDLGTSGLLVVAKREAALRHLCEQFKARTVSRVYTSITLGCPRDSTGRVLTNIDRDAADRKRMAAYPYQGVHGRVAASNYSVVSVVAAGGAAVVEWRLETGRTHQIRVHAKHIGHPLLSDVTYGGGGAAAINALGRNKSSRQSLARQVVAGLGRPALHARTLAFDHPASGERLSFEVPLPGDMQGVLQLLEGKGWE